MTPTVMRQELANGAVCIAPEGRLDTFTVPAFEAALSEQLDSGRLRLIVSLANVTYVSSSGLRALLSARRRAREAGGDVVLSGLAPRVREIFEMVGFVGLFGIYASVEEAAGALGAAPSAG